MERELWPQWYHRIRAVGREFHRQSVQYQPWVIVLVLVWADRPVSWDVTPLNEAEVKVAEETLVPQLQGGGCLLADGNDDRSPLHDAVAKRNDQLVAPAKSPNAGQGHHDQSPFRRRSIELLQGEFGPDLFALRGQIERDFGNVAAFAGGLTAPPA
ncbi:MAG: hypothetical protein SH850_00250 [Planctomycetaceae bacterium]|nr:hypothetical protein [Planctomycetaceae bacterium]